MNLAHALAQVTVVAIVKDGRQVDLTGLTAVDAVAALIKQRVNLGDIARIEHHVHALPAWRAAEDR